MRRIRNLLSPVDKKLLIVFLFGFLVRLLYIGNIPGNTALYSDELFSGYESWSLLKYGIDYRGYHLPVYLPVWGGGMSIMQALCQMPFIAIFGLNSFSLRLPAAILGCITLYCFYYICLKSKGADFALFATFILSVMPWHIMQSRWALDCNYFVGFMAISIALLIKASENNKYLPLASLFFGLTLYTYALPWMVMPLFAIGSVCYLLLSKKITSYKYLGVSTLVLLVMAIPLMLFVLVNYDIIPEIVTPIFSVPKLPHFRSDEFSFSAKNVLRNFYNTLQLFVSQDDGRVSDVTPMFGLYYKFSNVFIFVGLASCIVSVFGKMRKSEYTGEFFIALQFVCALIIGSITEIFFSRINIIHIPMTYFCALGLWKLVEVIKGKSREIAVVVYSLACFAFLIYYFTYHDDNVALAYDDGCEDAIEYIDDSLAESGDGNDSTVYLFSGVYFTHVLFYEKYPTPQFIEDVEYADLEVTGGSMIPRKLGKYDLTVAVEGAEYPEARVGNYYVCSTSDTAALEYFKEYGLIVEYFNYIAVAHY